MKKNSNDIRFGFGKNWSKYLGTITKEKIMLATKSLQEMLSLDDLVDMKVIDVGSGSGLFSLSAANLGAEVYSFDYDINSVKCTNYLRKKYHIKNTGWTVSQGSILDTKYIDKLGQYDIVYSWGVLHHTGNLWIALDNACKLVRNHGQIFISIYNDQGIISKYWYYVKKLYNQNILLKYLLLILHLPYLYLFRHLIRFILNKKSLDRGMSLWYDALDWLGGFPFEVSKPDNIISFFGDRGFILDKLVTVGGRHGCNEFIFTKKC